jgi:ribose-phosphate pyrophosphokinase
MIKFNDEIIEQKTFPDGTPLLKMPTLKEAGEVNAVLWKYENMGELFSLVCLVRQVVLPYIPNARQDRMADEENDVFTLKWFCEIINSLNFERVTLIDAHSAVSTALLDRSHALTAKRMIDAVVDKVKPDLLFFPDNGAAKKYSEFMQREYAFGIKNRDWKTGKIQGLDIVGDVKGKKVLIVDDISSYGGTFLHSAKKLKELGAKKIWLYVTHCENSILEGELIKNGLLEKIYTTDSIFTGEHGLIEIVHRF